MALVGERPRVYGVWVILLVVQFVALLWSTGPRSTKALKLVVPAALSGLTAAAVTFAVFVRLALALGAEGLWRRASVGPPDRLAPEPGQERAGLSTPVRPGTTHLVEVILGRQAGTGRAGDRHRRTEQARHEPANAGGLFRIAVVQDAGGRLASREARFGQQTAQLLPDVRARSVA